MTAAFHGLDLRIQKPGETDEDYLCQWTGERWQYLLATHNKIYGVDTGGGPWRGSLNSEQREKIWPWLLTPLGGYRPLPHARKFHRSRKRFRHALGGNRSSKSHSLAVETMWRAMGIHPFRADCKAPSTGWWATTTFEKVADTLWAKLDPAKDGLLKGIELLDYRWDIVWRSKQHSIPSKILVHLPKCGISEIILKAYEQGRESFQAAELDWGHFDEQYPEPIFVETTSRIGPGKQAEFADALTPLSPSTWLEKRTSIKIPKTDAVYYFPLDDNRVAWGGFIEDALIDAQIYEWAPEVRETRRNGRWGAYTGQIFKTWNRAIHVVDEEKEKRLFWKKDKIPGNFTCVGSIDWGGNNPFGFVFASRIPHLDNDWYVHQEYYWQFREQGPRRLEEHANEIKRMLAGMGVMMERTWADHDPTDANEFSAYGVPSQPADKDVLPGIETIQSLLAPREHLSNSDWPKGRPRLHVAARCEYLIQQIASYHWEESPSPDAKDPKDRPVKVNDHLLDAARYLLHSEKAYEPTEAAQAFDIRGKYRRDF